MRRYLPLIIASILSAVACLGIGLFGGMQYERQNSKQIVRTVTTTIITSKWGEYPWNSTELATLEETVSYLSEARDGHWRWANNIGKVGYPIDAYTGGAETQLQMAKEYDRILSFLNTLVGK